MVDAVQPDAEQVHYLQQVNPSERMAVGNQDFMAVNFLGPKSDAKRLSTS